MRDQYFLLKITLTGSEPLVWRRFVVPGNISLDRLHDVIQVVMGWEDCHLYQFTIGKKRYTERPDRGDGASKAGTYHLMDLAKKRGRTFQYLYDFGDNWEHEITIEEVITNPGELDMPICCLEGERACPPEDVGGIFGFQRFCEIMANPQHEEYEYLRGWYTGDPAIPEIFSAERFDLFEINNELLKFLRWSRDRAIFWNWISR